MQIDELRGELDNPRRRDRTVRPATSRSLHRRAATAAHRDRRRSPARSSSLVAVSTVAVAAQPGRRPQSTSPAPASKEVASDRDHSHRRHRRPRVRRRCRRVLDASPFVAQYARIPRRRPLRTSELCRRSEQWLCALQTRCRVTRSRRRSSGAGPRARSGASPSTGTRPVYRRRPSTSAPTIEMFLKVGRRRRDTDAMRRPARDPTPTSARSSS